MEKAGHKSDKEKTPKIIDASLYLLVFATVAVTALDLWSHSNGGVIDGVANIERRQQLIELFGPIARNIGNYGFTAILTTLAVLTKHLALAINPKESLKPVINFAFLGSLSSIVALNAGVENTLSPNPEGWADFIVSVIALVKALGSSEFLIAKAKGKI